MSLVLSRSCRRVAKLAVTILLVCAATSRAQGVAAQGQLREDTLYAKTLEKNLYGDSPDRAVLVYLPPSYNAQPARRYPVVYLLHGFGGTERSWVRGYSGFNIARAMDSLVATGSAREMIVVMPNARTRFDGSFYTNSTSTGNWDEFISKELVDYVDHKYRTLSRADSRGLAGHSMGGYGTLAVGMRHANDVYGALYALSACCTHFPGDAPAATVWGPLLRLSSVDSVARLAFYPKVNLALSAAFSPNPGKAPLYVDLPVEQEGSVLRSVDPVLTRWSDHAPLDMIPKYRGRLARLRGLAFDVGLGDILVPSAQLVAMDRALTAAGIAHTFETYDGDHSNRIGDRLITRVIPFFSRTLDFGDSSRP